MKDIRYWQQNRITCVETGKWRYLWL